MMEKKTKNMRIDEKGRDNDRKRGKGKYNDDESSRRELKTIERKVEERK